MTSPLTSAETSQAAQSLVAGAAGDLVTQAFSTLQVEQLSQSLPRFQRLIAAIVGRYGRASGSAALMYYRQERAAAAAAGTFTPQLAPLPPTVQIDKTVNWATQPLWSAAPDRELALQQVRASTERLVQSVGRQTIIGNVHDDPAARGWYRQTEPGACYFCLLLATRGAVYKSERTAGFQAHDECHCHPAATFTAYQPTAEVQRWQQIYKDAVRGTSGKASIKAFRKAVEDERSKTATPSRDAQEAPA